MQANNNEITCEKVFVQFITELANVLGRDNARALLNSAFRRVGEKIASEIKCSDEMDCIVKSLELMKRFNGIVSYDVIKDRDHYVVRTVGKIGRTLKNEGYTLDICIDEPIAGMLAGMLKRLLGKKVVKVKEMTCVAKGDDYCEFLIYIK